MDNAAYSEKIEAINQHLDIQGFRVLLDRAMPSTLSPSHEALTLLVSQSKNFEVVGWHFDWKTLRVLALPACKQGSAIPSSLLLVHDLEKVLIGCVNGVIKRTQEGPCLTKEDQSSYNKFVSELLKCAQTHRAMLPALWRISMEQQQYSLADKVIATNGKKWGGSTSDNRQTLGASDVT